MSGRFRSRAGVRVHRGVPATVVFQAGVLIALGWVASFVLLLGASEASADNDVVSPFTPSAEEVHQAEVDSSPRTNPEAARNLEHADLERGEAAHLLQAVFGPILVSPTGIFHGLEVERFLSDNAALISSDDLPDALDQGATGGGDAEMLLLESTVPLRTDGEAGAGAAVDLGLERTGDELQPANPLIEVSLPDELAEGFELPGASVTLKLNQAPAERSASILGGSIAFYPNVAADTDLAVSATPRGFETFTQLRTPDAPLNQRFSLDLPAGANLEPDEMGGAVASIAGEPVVVISPPSAVDANGASVPVDLQVDGHSFELSVHPTASTAYPIAVDPTIQDAYNWYYDGHPGWTSANTGGPTNAFRAPDTGCSTYCFLRVSGASGTYAKDTQSFWQYAVPRFFKDYEDVEKRPTSWIQAYSLGNITFATAGDWQASPGALFAVSDSAGAWRTASLLPPNQSGGYSINLSADHTGKLASFGLFSSSQTWISNERYLLTGEAQVVLGDETAPSIGSIASPVEWVDTKPKPFDLTVSDAGLGVRTLAVKTGGGTTIGTTVINNCTGTLKSSCPREWKGAQEGRQVNYDPTTLPQGVNNLKLDVSDPVGNLISKTLQLRVDHSSPTIGLSGSMTEQSTLGQTLPQYALKISAQDGTLASPQSGVAKVEVKLDNVKVKEWSPGCSSENCSLSSEWVLKAADALPGKHKAEVIATDAVGRKSPVKIVEFELKKDETAPVFENLSAFYTAPSGWVEQDSYEPKVNVSDAKGYGVTTVQLKIDSQIVQSAAQSCTAGGCSKQFGYGQVINMASYEGGAHPAELIATDGAGNTRKRAWTINVDPEGHISVSEASDTLSAFEDTTSLQPVATTPEFLEPEIIEAGDNPHLIEAGQGFEATGVPVEVSLGASASAGFAVEGTAGEIEVTPVNQGEASPSDLAGNGAAAVSSNSSTGVDTVYRPEYNGLLLFSSIRESTSPEAYSWQVHLGSGQSLKALNSEQAVVTYQDGTEAFLISAETAKDAAGTPVPTALAVNGSVVTLTVKHKSSQFVYPVVAQQEFETPYSAPLVVEMPIYEGPPPVEEEGEANEWVPGDDDYITDAQAKWFVTPSLAVNDNPPFSSNAYPQVRTIYRSACGPNCGKWKLITENAAYKTNSADTTWWEGGTQVQARYSQKTIWKPFIFLGEYGCGAKGPLKVEKGSGEHLTAFGKFNVTSFVGKKKSPTITPAYDENFGLRVWVYPNGFQEKHLTGWDGLAGYGCPTAITYN